MEHTQAILLMDLYKGLLTPRQAQILDLYFEEDLSLSEIQENLQISRAAASSTIQKALHTMEKYDEILHLQAKYSALEQFVQEHPEHGAQIQQILDL